MRSLWQEIEELDGRVPAELQNQMLLDSVRMIERATRWFLRHAGRPLDVTACVARFESDIIVVAAQLEDLLPPRAKARVRRRYRRLRDRDIAPSLASRIASIEVQPSACDVARCARVSGVPVERVGKIYFALGERFDFDRLRSSAAQLGGGTWQQTAITALIGDLYSHQAELARQVASHPGKTRAAIEAWKAVQHEAVGWVEEILRDVVTVPRGDLARLAVAERELRHLLELTGPIYDRRNSEGETS